MALYTKYHKSLGKKKTPKAEAIRAELKEKFEKDYSYEKIILLRTIATKKYEFENLYVTFLILH